MKNTRLTSILSSSLIAGALTIGSLASTQSALAQSETALAEVNIPFSFQTATQTMPAGTYRIDQESGYLVLLRRDQTRRICDDAWYESAPCC